MTSSKKRNLGKNMKPRGIKAETTLDLKDEKSLSAGEVQDIGVKEPVLEAQESIETPVKQESETVQILDSNDVAPEKAELDYLLKASKSEVASGFSPLPSDALFEALKQQNPLMKVENGKFELIPKGMGPQEDGTFKIAVTIREGLIDPIEEQAKYDGQTSEEWVSQRFGEWLETWWQPAQGR